MEQKVRVLKNLCWRVYGADGSKDCILINDIDTVEDLIRAMQERRLEVPKDWERVYLYFERIPEREDVEITIIDRDSLAEERGMEYGVTDYVVLASVEDMRDWVYDYHLAKLEAKQNGKAPVSQSEYVAERRARIKADTLDSIYNVSYVVATGDTEEKYFPIEGIKTIPELVELLSKSGLLLPVIRENQSLMICYEVDPDDSDSVIFFTIASKLSANRDEWYSYRQNSTIVLHSIRNGVDYIHEYDAEKKRCRKQGGSLTQKAFIQHLSEQIPMFG